MLGPGPVTLQALSEGATQVLYWIMDGDKLMQNLMGKIDGWDVWSIV